MNHSLEFSGRGRRPLASTSFISMLSEDVLLNIFNCCRLDIPPGWDHKWWYKLMHTCSQWRRIILAFPSSLQLHLHCTYGTPIEDMLKYSARLPIRINFNGERSMSQKDEDGALLALQHHDRVRFINLKRAFMNRFFSAMNKPFPILEDLRLSFTGPESALIAETFTAPRLRHFYLVLHPWFQRLPLLTSVVGLVTLSIGDIPSPHILPVKYLVSRLSLMPQLEYLSLGFFDLPSLVHFDESNLAEPLTVQLQKLVRIDFRGVSSYLEDLVARMRAPLLARFTLLFLPNPSFPLPHLSELLTAAGELRFHVISVTFSESEKIPGAYITVASSEQTVGHSSIRIRFSCEDPVASASQICAALAPMLLDVKNLRLNYQPARRSLGLPKRREAWFDLLRPFCNVQKVQVNSAMTPELSLALCPRYGSPAEGILSKLCEFSLLDRKRFQKVLDPFIAARKAAGQPIAKHSHPPTSDSDSEEDEWSFVRDCDAFDEFFYSNPYHDLE
ncbi:hypothetical protein BJV74DRAFT_798683 [Russula compacta]|nr:hypothetical protein BJV74DRAFT_798683 [Russula compacta]